MNDAVTRNIPLKLHIVIAPGGKTHYVYAQTRAGAIKAVKDAQPKQEETWSAAPATIEQAAAAARTGAVFINDPNPPADTAAPNGVGGEALTIDHGTE